MTETLMRAIAEATARAEERRSTEALRSALVERGCYIYGAGGYGRVIASAVRAQNYEARGFVDTFRGGGELIDGVPCFRPEEVAAKAADSVLIVAVNNFKTPVDDIVRWARSAPFAEVIHVAELPDIFGSDVGHYWQASRSLIAANVEHIGRFHAMLGDERSRQTLAQLARFRISGEPDDHPPVDREHQYFPADLPFGKRSISVVDCGAYPGDMLVSVGAAGFELDSWYAFEPDPTNFRHLCEVSAGGRFRSASLFPCGVGNETGLIRFSEGAADASRALGEDDVDSGIVVPVVRVGDVVHATSIDMVKLDVEGAEAAAIDGMIELLDRHRPRVAIAAYHRPSDLWELAFKMDALFPRARYAIRQHGYNGYDTVLYVDL